MLKIIFLLFIFFNFLFADANTTTMEINYIKTDVSKNYAQLNKIKSNLENIKIKQIAIEKGIDNYKENLGNINNRINDLNSNINLYGILITVLTILYTIFHYITSKNKFDELYYKIKDKFDKRYKKIKKNHEKSSNLNIKIDDIYGDMLMKKALYHSIIREFDEALNLYDKIVDEYKNHKKFQIKAVKASINAIELSLIKNNFIDNRYKKIIDKFQEIIDDKDIAIYEMLLIIENKVKEIENNKNFDDWKLKYSKYNKQMVWRFDELNNWAKQIKDEKIEELINKFIPYFDSKDLPI